MSFKVNAADIKAYGEMIGRAKDDMSAGANHVRKEDNEHNKISGGSQLWKGILTQHKSICSRVETALNQYERVLASSAQELRKSADYYRRTDEEEARKVDSTYPGGLSKVPSPSPGANTQGFNDRESARDALNKVEGHFEDRYEAVVGARSDSLSQNLANGRALGALRDGVGFVLDLTSPSTLLNEGLKLAFDFDVLDEFAQMIAGDWGKFADVEATWERIGNLCVAVAKNIESGNETLSTSWQGKAAASGWHYFNGLTQQLNEFADAFDRLIANYEALATDIAAFVNSLKLAITLILDKAIEVALKAAVAGAAASTGVGLVLTGASAASIALDIVQMLGRYTEVVLGLSALFAVLNTIEGSSTSDLEKELSKITNFPTPGNSYDHRAV
ncbi:hypothetical protein MTQ01_00360 [Streptomyces sp. XM4193]|uniref:hypothetical protein n=1 Tax=Streptomyces sp. XM4193 TaxID=2929782 RepID=UPI001FFB3B00|nr:hypothetical protein [Streptomyces sp. XM4193]MCK1794504.1 hypothetical protein [Streptomyces sp. XM4193]